MGDPLWRNYPEEPVLLRRSAVLEKDHGCAWSVGRHERGPFLKIGRTLQPVAGAGIADELNLELEIGQPLDRQ